MSPPLVIAAHGSADPRFAEVVDAVAAMVRESRPPLDVRVGYLDHGPPDLTDVTSSDAVVVPLLLASGYHVRVDIPAQSHGAVVSAAVGPDPRLAPVLEARLHSAGWKGVAPVLLAAAGSSDERALDDVHRAAVSLADHTGVEVTACFVSAGTPRLVDLLTASPAAAVATYLLSPGAFHDMLVQSGAAVVADPIGADPALAEIALDRYDAEVVRA